LFSPCFLPFGKAGRLQIQRFKGFTVDDYGFTICALALKPSGFCNIGVKIQKDCNAFGMPIFY